MNSDYASTIYDVRGICLDGGTGDMVGSGCAGG